MWSNFLHSTFFSSNNSIKHLQPQQVQHRLVSNWVLAKGRNTHQHRRVRQNHAKVYCNAFNRSPAQHEIKARVLSVPLHRLSRACKHLIKIAALSCSWLTIRTPIGRNIFVVSDCMAITIFVWSKLSSVKFRLPRAAKSVQLCPLWVIEVDRRWLDNDHLCCLHFFLI